MIQGDGKGQVFDIEGGSLALDGLTISGGRAVRGGGIRNKGGRLLLTDVVIRGNRARVGGGLCGQRRDGRAERRGHPRQPGPDRQRPVQHPQRNPHLEPVAGRAARMNSHFPRVSGELGMNRIEVKSGHRRQRVADVRRTSAAAAVGAGGSRAAALLSTLTVSNTDDSGAGSLRAAIVQADADGGGDTIVFSSLFNTPQTITLTSGQLELTGTATTMINGPGANLLTVNGGDASRVFAVYGGFGDAVGADDHGRPRGPRLRADPGVRGGRNPGGWCERHDARLHDRAQSRLGQSRG